MRLVVPLLGHFRALEPAHVINQSQSFAWLADVHARAEATETRATGKTFDEPAFRERIAALLGRVGCGEDKIARRGHAIADCGHTRFSEMEIYRVEERGLGEGALARTRAFERVAEGVFARLYAERDAPSDLLHVTCTGYVSPSAAQRLVSSKGWGSRTRVTHAYHMGCYAALPALRSAAGLFLLDEQIGAEGPRRSDVVHTEMPSLHLNPLAHTPEQLVVQSLFADGFIGYSLYESGELRSPALALLALDERIVPDTADSMTWVASDWGMQMTLARDVPERLAAVIVPFVTDLVTRAGLTPSERQSAVYAVHPGGPKILDGARDMLDLREEQLAWSRKVLFEHGNMSSATLPYVWMELLRSKEVPHGRAVVSLAFGPGLTICGAVLRKVTHT